MPQAEILLFASLTLNTLIIIQLFGDSKKFDETRFIGLCDLVFVDGSHALSYVESDSRKALRMVKPGGSCCGTTIEGHTALEAYSKV